MKNKKLLQGVIVVSMLVCAAISSCNKAKDNSRKGMLIGEWKVMEQGMDDNGNGTWDLSEHVPAIEGYETEVKFDGNGRGSTSSYLGAVSTIPFNWELVNADNDIRFICDYAGSVDTSYENIVSFSSGEVVTRRSNGVTTHFSGMQKQ